jgi:hypothetical protein
MFLAKKHWLRRTSKGSKKNRPYEAVFGRKAMVTEMGIQREVNTAEAMLLYLAREGLKGGVHEAKEILAAIQSARMKPSFAKEQDVDEIRFTTVALGNPIGHCTLWGWRGN